jgi:hypothetical protein
MCLRISPVMASRTDLTEAEDFAWQSSITVFVRECYIDDLV